MRTKKVTRHYCDYCSKGMFKAPEMLAHETICFSNPKRSCYLCENAGEPLVQVADLLKLHPLPFHSDVNDREMDTRSATPEFVAALRKLVNDCPACMLAVLKQGKIFAFDLFDYKKEKSDYESEKRRENMGCIGL